MSRPKFIYFGHNIAGDLAQAEQREWWLSNGVGAYAAGTVAGTLTRRYHGLLIAPLQPPLGRSLIFSKADAFLETGEESFPLFSNRWQNALIDPQGYTHIEAFWLDGRMPVWRFCFGDISIQMRIWMEPGEHTVNLAYYLDNAENIETELKLRIQLLVNARDHHGNAEPSKFNPIIEQHGKDTLIVVNPQGSGSHSYQLKFRARGGEVTPKHEWMKNFDLLAEAEYGLPSRDHHLCVGEYILPLVNGEWSGLTASLEKDPSPYIEESMRRFFANDEGVLTRAQINVAELREAPDWIQQLTLAADSFLFNRPFNSNSDSEAIIAGYPWFGDWGRDTMIALSSLSLATGRYDSARQILQTFARFIDCEPPPGNLRPETHKVDAALWYIEAWRAYFDKTNNLIDLRTIFPVLKRFIDNYCDSKVYGMALDKNDGLLTTSGSDVQITRMDSRISDWVVAPLTGKPVEINALWYNALETMAHFEHVLMLDDKVFEKLAAKTRTGFQRFINTANGGLFDILDGAFGDDPKLRPNQILAVSLPFTPLTDEIQRSVIKLCGTTLPTFYSFYVPACEHHQGTTWAWLLGRYAIAEYRLNQNVAQAMERLHPIRDHLFDCGLGMVSEIFDLDPPHLPRGAPAQAWSVACVLEAWFWLERERLRLDQ